MKVTKTTEWVNKRTACDLEAMFNSKELFELGKELNASVKKSYTKRRNALEIKLITNWIHGNVNHKDIKSKNNGLKG